MGNYLHGKNTFFAIYDAAGASQVLSGNGYNVTLTSTVNNLENTGFGAVGIQRAGSGLFDFKIQFEAWGDDTATSGNLRIFEALKGLGTAFCFAPGGSAAGSASPLKWTACAVVDDSEVRSPVNGLVVCRATLSQRSGSLTTGCSWTAIF